jgi:tetratricopeptide (TPR) repeat protein
MLAPTSSFVSRPDCAFEHRMYLPLAACVVLFVIALYRFVQHLGESRKLSGSRVRAVALCASGMVVAVLVVATHCRNRVYRSAESMWTDVVRKRPANFRARTALVSVLLENRRFEEAESAARELIAGIAQSERDAGGRRRSRAELAANYYPDALNQLGLALFARGKNGEAMRSFDEALRAKPGFLDALHNKALVLLREDRHDEAMQCLETALALPGVTARTLALKALVQERTGLFERAVRDYRESLRLDPDHIGARRALAWLLATCPVDSVRDGDEAVGMAFEVCRRTGFESVAAMDALGAAYAEAGRFTEATAAAQKALALAGRRGRGSGQQLDKESAAGIGDLGAIKRRLELYEREMPFRSESHEKTVPRDM